MQVVSLSSLQLSAVVAFSSQVILLPEPRQAAAVPSTAACPPEHAAFEPTL